MSFDNLPPGVTGRDIDFFFGDCNCECRDCPEKVRDECVDWRCCDDCGDATYVGYMEETEDETLVCSACLGQGYTDVGGKWYPKGREPEEETWLPVPSGLPAPAGWEGGYYKQEVA